MGRPLRYTDNIKNEAIARENAMRSEYHGQRCEAGNT